MATPITAEQASLAAEYAKELEIAHRENEELKAAIFEVDKAIAVLLEMRKRLKQQLG